ncbi:uroporphyrinogen-III synthase [Planctomycetota bacterium]
MAKSLEGIRIILLRPREQSFDLQKDLESRSARVILFPTIRIVPDFSGINQQQLELKLKQYDFILFSSANAAMIFRQLLNKLSLKLENPRIYAIGGKTAQIAAEQGFTVDWVSSRAVMEALVEELATEVVKGQKGLFPCSRLAAETAQTGLLSHGITLDRLEIYDNKPEYPPKQLLVSELEITGPLFCFVLSPSSICNLANLLSEKELQIARNKVQFLSIGPVSSRAIESFCLHVAAEASPHNAEGMVTALEELVGG